MAQANESHTDGPVDIRGAIDCDGHILEPPDLWERYLEPRFRDRAIRIRTAPDGLEYFEYEGQKARLPEGGFAGVLGAMGQHDIVPSPERSYVASSPAAATEPHARVKRLDQEGLAKAILYPTIGLLWEAEVKDAELSAAYCRAYNRWIVEFCSAAPGRLYPIAHLSLGDPELATRELQRAIGEGCKGAFLAPFTWTEKAPGHPDHAGFWAVAQDLGVPIALHPTFEPAVFSTQQRFAALRQGEPLEFKWYVDVLVAQGMQQAFASLFHYGIFEEFPRLKIVVLESQAGWIGYFLERMDAVFAGPLGRGVPLREPPSFYFKRQCWISADPDERSLSHIIEPVGADKFFWASDYPHPDHTGDYIERLRGLVAPLSAPARSAVLWENVAKVYALD